MNTVFTWFYTFIANAINWMFNMMIVEGVSIGALLVVLVISSLVISNLVLVAKR